MIAHNSIVCPCFGTLNEIHTALVKDLKWLDNQVTINGWGYTVKEAGFQSNHNGRIYPVSEESKTRGLTYLHPGTGILIDLRYDEDSDEPQEPPFWEIVTSGKVPHVSKRCAECGVQLNHEEIKHGACLSCYSEAVNTR